MIEKTLYDFFRIVANHEYLERIADVDQPLWGAGYIIDIIDVFVAELKELGLTVTLRASHDLLELRSELAACPKDAKLSSMQLSKLREITSKLWPTLQAESGGMVAYIVSERRFPIERLLGGVDGLFGKDVFQRLPVFAQHDFTEAARCLAFQRATAAAFHMLRGNGIGAARILLQEIASKARRAYVGANRCINGSILGAFRPLC